MTAPPPDRQVGSVADEAARLVQLLRSWSDRAAPDDDAPSAYAEADGAPSAAHDPLTCRACPLCRALAHARAVRPELVGYLASAAEALAATLRDLAAPPEAGGRPAGGDPTYGERPEWAASDCDVDDEGGGAA